MRRRIVSQCIKISIYIYSWISYVFRSSWVWWRPTQLQVKPDVYEHIWQFLLCMPKRVFSQDGQFTLWRYEQRNAKSSDCNLLAVSPNKMATKSTCSLAIGRLECLLSFVRQKENSIRRLCCYFWCFQRFEHQSLSPKLSSLVEFRCGRIVSLISVSLASKGWFAMTRGLFKLARFYRCFTFL